MKRKISVCIIVFSLVILTVAAMADRPEQPAPMESEQEDFAAENEPAERTIEVNSDPLPYAYILRDRDGWVVVCRADRDEIYMETGIMVRCLPDEIAAALQSGIGIKDETELFDFLENYSS